MEATLTPASTSVANRAAFALFLTGCVLTLFQMSYLSANAIGITGLGMQLVGSSVLLAILGLPFGYLMHAAGNGRALAIAFLLWLFIGLINLMTVVTNWPAKWMLTAQSKSLIRIHDSLREGEERPIVKRFGPLKVESVWRFKNGNTWFVTNKEGNRHGLLYAPSNEPFGFNQWSCVQVADKWYMIEED